MWPRAWHRVIFQWWLDMTSRFIYSKSPPYDSISFVLSSLRCCLASVWKSSMKWKASSQRTSGWCMSWCTRTVVHRGTKWDLETMFLGLGGAWWEKRCFSEGRAVEGSWSLWAVSCRRANLLTCAHVSERDFGRSSRMTEKDLEVKPEWRRRKEE